MKCFINRNIGVVVESFADYYSALMSCPTFVNSDRNAFQDEVTLLEYNETILDWIFEDGEWTQQ